MNVVILIDHLGSGGAQRQAVEIARRLQSAHGVNVTFLVWHDIDFHGPRLREAGVRVIQVPRRGKLDLLFPARIRAQLVALRPDVVHAFLVTSCLWGWLAWRGLPVASRPVFIAAERSDPARQSRFARLVTRLVYPRADHVTANAGPAATWLARELRIDPARIHYLPNGIDLADWDRQREAALPWPLEPDRFHVALVGGLREEKNHALVLEALERMSAEERATMRVWFVGADSGGASYAAWVRAEIPRRGLADLVRCVPPTPAISALMHALDALVLPSRYEGFPNVLLEAMASGLPAIASPVGDVPTMLEDGRTGFLVAPDDGAGLADALRRLRDMGPEGRRALGRRARALVEERYTLERIAAAQLALYCSACAGLLPGHPAATAPVTPLS